MLSLFVRRAELTADRPSHACGNLLISRKPRFLHSLSLQPMIAFRYSILILSLLFACRLACAESPPAWQPCREVVSPSFLAPLSPEVVPAQYHFVEPQPAGIPVDALTDIELNALNAACCSDTFTTGHPPANSVVPFTDPVLASSTDPGAIELLPSDLIWHSYWAGAKEPRTSGVVFRDTSGNLSLLDVSLGGRTSIFRKGQRVNGKPLGWEMQIEGAAQLRLNLDRDFDFDSADFRFGVPLIYAPNEQLHWKFAYYHLSSHIGDEFLVRNPGFTRINFSRDVLVFGASIFPRPAWRWYAELGWAFYDDEGSDPWEIQFGLDLAQPGPTSLRGTPFLALNSHLREEVHFGGNLVVQAGWLWRGQTGRVLRTGLHYYNGKSPQFEFFDNFEQHLGIGLWQEY